MSQRPAPDPRWWVQYPRHSTTPTPAPLTDNVLRLATITHAQLDAFGQRCPRCEHPGPGQPLPGFDCCRTNRMHVITWDCGHELAARVAASSHPHP
ncbi:hypothetical protein [Streptomyces noursei]